MISFLTRVFGAPNRQCGRSVAIQESQSGLLAPGLSRSTRNDGWKAWLIAVFALLTTLPASAQQPYPSRQVHIIEPLAAASAVDVVARLIADRLSQDLGQSFYVDNQPGAAGLLGMRTGAKSAPPLPGIWSNITASTSSRSKATGPTQRGSTTMFVIRRRARVAHQRRGGVIALHILDFFRSLPEKQIGADRRAKNAHDHSGGLRIRREFRPQGA